MLENQDNLKYRIALPKKGRLAEAFSELARVKGVGFSKESSQRDWGCIEKELSIVDSRIEVLYSKPADMFANFEDGILSGAVMGRDSFMEYVNKQQQEGFAPTLKVKTAFKKCDPSRFAIASPEDLQNPQELSGARIATSYRYSLQNWLDRKGVRDVQIVDRVGGVEGCVRLGLADAVFDIVQSGKSLLANGLRQNFRASSIYPVYVEVIDNQADQGARSRELAETVREVFDGFVNEQVPQYT